MKTALVLGGSGLIGSFMVERLKDEGYWVRCVDIKNPDYHIDKSDEFILGDLRDNGFVSVIMFGPNQKSIDDVSNSFDEVYQFAADMGGAGYIFTGDHDADVMRNSAMINVNVADNAIKFKVKKLFYSSSACIYPKELQTLHEASLKESDAYPANPDSDYGIEKLFSERLYLAHGRNHGLNLRIARFHNIYGPRSPYLEPKSKAPAAMCRKVVEKSNDMDLWISKNKDTASFVNSMGSDIRGTIAVWGDGLQTRSFLYIDDCIDAVRLLMQSDFKEPINIGSEEMISINDLAKMVIDISGKSIEIKNIPGPVGVRGRNSNNDLIRKVLNWEPKYSLRQGMEKTYEWVNSQLNNPAKINPLPHDYQLGN